MTKLINCFIPFEDKNQVQVTVKNLKSSELINKVYLIRAEGAQGDAEGLDCEVIDVPSLKSTVAMKKIAEKADTAFSMIYTQFSELSFGLFALERMIAIAEDSGAAMVYADHFNEADGVRTFAPVIDYQEGSLRDES